MRQRCDLKPGGISIKMRRGHDFKNIMRRERFKIDIAVHASIRPPRGVVAFAGFRRQRGVSQAVVAFHNQRVFARHKQIGDIEIKWRVAAFAPSKQLPVQPDRTAQQHAFEAEPDQFCLIRRRIERKGSKKPGHAFIIAQRAADGVEGGRHRHLLPLFVNLTKRLPARFFAGFVGIEPHAPNAV